MKVVPAPELLTVMRPRCASTRAFTIAESDPGAAVVAVARGVGPVEPFEDMGQVLGEDALAGIGHRQRDAPVGSHAGLDRHPATGRSMSQRVVEQVAQDLGQPVRVRPQRRQVLVRPPGQRHALVVEPILGRGDRGGHHGVRRHRDRRDRGRAFFGLGQGTGIVGEPDQAVRLLAQHRNSLGVRSSHAVLDGLEVGLQNRNRSPDLMGKIAEQSATAGVDSLQPPRPSD